MFKITKVNSQIRKSHTLFWYRNKNIDYILNGYWAIKVDLRKEKYRKILSTLVERFGMIPVNNQEFRRVKTYKADNITKLKGKPDWFGVLEGKPDESLLDTKLIDARERQQVRIFKGTNYNYVNVKFLEMIDVEGLTIKGGDPLEPVFFNKEGNFLMVMPVRMNDSNEYMREIKKAQETAISKGQ